jgi:hypothetical protein
MARVNYQRDKRLKDLDRQRKQEEKRNKRILKDLTPGAPEGENPAETQTAPAEGEPEA